VAAGAARPLVREPYVAAYVHGESGMDGPELPPPATTPVAEHAVDFLAARIAASERPITLVPTGPLTNIGLLLARHPGAAEGIERIVLMGGAIAEGNVTPAAEFNIWADPEAAARVFTSGIDVTMVGLDVTHKALFRPADSERLAATGRVGKLVAELFGFYQEFHSQQYGWDGSPVHDAVAVAHVVRPGLVETADRGVVVDCGGELSRGRTYVDLWGRAHWEPNAHVAVDIDAQGFVDFLVERLSSPG
jgi:pyrimidine-specific ribonucleoside hydrolase